MLASLAVFSGLILSFPSTRGTCARQPEMLEGGGWKKLSSVSGRAAQAPKASLGRCSLAERGLGNSRKTISRSHSVQAKIRWERECQSGQELFPDRVADSLPSLSQQMSEACEEVLSRGRRLANLKQAHKHLSAHM